MADAASPLDAAQQAALRDANERLGSFMGAAKVASFNGWTLGICAAASILFGLFSPSGLVVGVGLAVVARNELVGCRRLRAFDPAALELLWRNQVGLLALIVAYCVWSMVRTTAAPDPQMAELTDLLGEGTGDLVRSLTLTVYAAVIVATVVFQGLNARYYHARVPRVKEHVERTPPWVLDLQRTV